MNKNKIFKKLSLHHLLKNDLFPNIYNQAGTYSQAKDTLVDSWQGFSPINGEPLSRFHMPDSEKCRKLY